MSIKPSTAEAIEFLQWRGIEPVLSAKFVEDKGDGGAFITKAWRAPVDWKAVEKWINQWQGKANIYYAVNPSSGAVDKKSKRADVMALQWLHVDCDVRPGEEQVAGTDRIIKKLEAYDPPPSYIVASGGGAQAFWKLAAPVPVNGDLSVAEDLKLYNLRIEQVLEGDHCHSLDHIMRLPGTINVPNEGKRKKGRAEALAVWYARSDATYDLGRFPQAEVAKPEAPPTDFSSADGSYETVRSDDQRLKALDADWVTLGLKGDTKGEYLKEGKTDRSRMAVAFATACIRAKVDPRVVASILMDPAWVVGECIRDKGGEALRHLKRTINKAIEYATSDKLAEMNEKHHVVNVKGKTLILTWDYEDEMHPGLPIPTYWTDEQFRKFYDKWIHSYEVENDKGESVTRKVPLGKWWWNHGGRRQYDGVVYAPHINEDTVGSKLNLWRGFSVQPAEGDCSLYLNHLRDNVCVDNDGNPVQEYLDYLIGWMAYAVQHPERQGHVSVVWLGRKGVGKTIGAEQFGKLFGLHYTSITNPEHMTGRFNAHLQRASVLLADECFFAGDRKHEQILKTLITGDRIFIEPKGINGYEVRNYLHIIMCTNNDWAVPASHDERRYFVLKVSEAKMQDVPYFEAIRVQMEEKGGRAALLHYLKGIDLSKHTVGGKPFEVRHAPKTGALREQQQRTRRGIDAFVEEVLVDGRVPFSHPSKPFVCITSGKDDPRQPWGFDHYIETKAEPDLRRLGPLRVKNALKEDWGCSHFRNRIAGKLVTGIEFPALSAMRRAFEDKHGEAVWPGSKDLEWEAADDAHDNVPF